MGLGVHNIFRHTHIIFENCWWKIQMIQVIQGPLPALHVHEGRSGSTPYLSFLGRAGGQVVGSDQRVGSWVCAYEKDLDKNSMNINELYKNL